MQYIGYDKARGERIGIEPERHTFIAGETGTGKSTLLVNLIMDRIEAGDGIMLEDPHGQVAEQVAERIPRWRLKDLVYFEPWAANPLCLNPLDHPDPAMARTMVKDLIQKTWPDGWGPQTEDLLTFILMAIQEVYRIPTLKLAQRMLRDDRFRTRVVSKIQNAEVRSYFEDIYDGEWDKKMRAEKSAPLFNKLNKFITEPVLRKVFGSWESLDFRKKIDERAILIFNLSQARIGRPNTAFLGGVIAFKHQQALLSRQDLLSAGKKPVPSYAYFDEFQVVMGADISVYLAEARKYGAALTIGTQTLSVLPLETQQKILTNCGTLLAYRVSRADAEIIAREFGDEYTPTKLTQTPDFHFQLLTIRDHVPQEPIEVEAFPPRERGKRDAGLERVLRVMENAFGTGGRHGDVRQGKADSRRIPGGKAGGSRRPHQAPQGAGRPNPGASGPGQDERRGAEEAGPAA